MEYASDSGPLNTVFAVVAMLACAVVAWKSIEYVLADRRRRRENPSDRDPRL